MHIRALLTHSCILQSPTHSHGLLMDSSWTLHNLLNSPDNPFKVLLLLSSSLVVVVMVVVVVCCPPAVVAHC